MQIYVNGITIKGEVEWWSRPNLRDPIWTFRMEGGGTIYATGNVTVIDGEEETENGKQNDPKKD